MKPYSLRLAIPKDYSRIKLLAESVWSNDYLIDGFLDILNDPKSHFLVLEDENQEIIGCINALIYTFNSQRLGYLETLRVRADSHNKGIGTFLTKEALEYLESKQITTVCYVTGLQNKKSVRVAIKNGFTQKTSWPAAHVDYSNISENLQNQPLYSEPSTKDILQILNGEKMGWYNCHWEFFPPSTSLINYLREDKLTMFIQSSDRNMLSYIANYESRLVGNIVGNPNKIAFLEIIYQIKNYYDLTDYEEFRLFIQDKYQSFYSKFPFIDFTKKKGVMLFIKEQ